MSNFGRPGDGDSAESFRLLRSSKPEDSLPDLGNLRSRVLKWGMGIFLVACLIAGFFGRGVIN